MGDWLRRLLYPLVLPLIVATVWLCGWVRQQEDRAAGDRRAFPPLSHPVFTSQFDPAANLPPGVGQRPRTEFFATADADEAVDDAPEEP